MGPGIDQPTKFLAGPVNQSRLKEDTTILLGHRQNHSACIQTYFYTNECDITARVNMGIIGSCTGVQERKSK